MKDLKAHVATSLVLSELIPIATNLVLNNISFVLGMTRESSSGHWTSSLGAFLLAEARGVFVGACGSCVRSRIQSRL